MANSQHILVVDDDPRIRKMLRRYLEGEGFTITEAAEGAAIRSAFAKGNVDLVLLDLMLGSEDGLALAREIRQRGATPIIMLTGKGDVVDRVVGLEAGADDYIAKPFHLREVLARIRTVLRRVPPTVPPLSAGASEPTAGVVTFEGWRMDLDRRELYRPSGEPVALTSGEFELLLVFATHPNRVLSRDQLMELVKGREWETYDRAMDTQIVRLRKKIEVDSARPTLIKTVRGAGYVFAGTVTRAR